MNILNFRKEPSINLASVINDVKEIETKIKQLKHKKEMLLAGLELYLNDTGHMYNGNGELIATKTPYFVNAFSASKFKSKHPDLHKSFLEQKEISGRWMWL